MLITQLSPIEQLQLEKAQLEQKVLYLEEQLEWFKRQIFGKQSEKIIPATHSQQLTFEGFDNPEKHENKKTESVPAHNRCKPNRNGQDAITLPSDLPVETIVLDVSAEQKICNQTGKPLVKIGEEITCKLAHKPGSYYIKKFIRPKYAFPQEENGILTIELPDTIIAKCRADDSFLAEVVTKKFADHQPLYRIAESLQRENINISRKLLSQWIVKLGSSLEPLYNLMLQKILASQNIFVDETPVDVQADGKVRQAYMWVLVGGKQANPAYRVYAFRESRSHKHAEQLLTGYSGILHSDKYGAYVALAQNKGITWCPCWAHIRRKFFEAEMGDSVFRDWILEKIKNLFIIEEKVWELSEEQRLHTRQDEAVPIIDELIIKIKDKLIHGKLLPKSKFREALGYFCSLIPYLKNYTQHANARLDNNVAERAIRPLAIGRKNWLFFGSSEGGKAAAILLSLVQTCRGLGINPREYLEDLFKRFMGHNFQALEELLPDQWLLTCTHNP